MVNGVGKNARFLVSWKVSPYDFTKERENEIKSKFAAKYGIDRNHIKVVPEFILLDPDGKELTVAKDVITNIQDPSFQVKLFKEYLDINKIEGYDFDFICNIDNELNALIDYNAYEKYCKYSIKWIKWSNFLSYGKDNFMDFTQFNGLTLLNGRNQVGKTTVSNDLIHFLLFGNTDKTKTLSDVFNRHLPEETQVTVEGCINIEGEDYIISRTLTRPALSRRTSKSKVTQKVEYYRLVGGSKEELSEYAEDLVGESTTKTNKIIKDTIGNESDFDLIMSITESNLDSLIEKKEAERGRLLARWIGMLPIETKDQLAREKFNLSIKPSLISNRYNSETLKLEIESYKTMINELVKSIERYKNESEQLQKDVANDEDMVKALMNAKMSVDKSLLKVDITTLNAKMDKLKSGGVSKANEIKTIDSTLAEIGDINFSVEEYDKLNDTLNKLNSEKGLLTDEYKRLSHDIEVLKKSEFCPTCGRKLDNVDNSDKIKECEDRLADVTKLGKAVANNIKETTASIEAMKGFREKYETKNKLSAKKVAIQLNLEQLRNEWKDCNSILKEYNRNSEAINKNNETDIKIRNLEVGIKGKRSAYETNIRAIADNEHTIKKYENEINQRNELIVKIAEEEKVLRNWKIYLDMVGKNGISKMVLRRALPIINAKLKEVLSEVCDFDVEISINDKNEINFFIIKDGVIADICSGSGFEKTATSLALRFVLGSVSMIPRLNYVTLDEVWGRVEEGNYDNIKTLLEKMLTEYDFLLLVSHQDQIKNWCEKALIAEKTNNVSHVRVATTREK